MKKRYIASLGAASLAAPFLAFAQTRSDLSTIINLVTNYMSQALFLLMGVAVVVFVWFVIKYYILPNEDRSKANMYVMWSIIGFFVILSFWGLVNIIQNTFKLQNENNSNASWSSIDQLLPAKTSNGNGNGNNFNGTATMN